MYMSCSSIMLAMCVYLSGNDLKGGGGILMFRELHVHLCLLRCSPLTFMQYVRRNVVYIYHMYGAKVLNIHIC